MGELRKRSLDIRDPYGAAGSPVGSEWVVCNVFTEVGRLTLVVNEDRITTAPEDE